MRADSFAALSFSLASSLAFSLVLTGCSLTSTAPSMPETGPAIHGNVHGGQQPIQGAHVYLFAAGTAGYGKPSVSLLNPPPPDI